MPLYSDHYYGAPPVSTYGQSSLYQSISGFNRAMAPPSGIISRNNYASHNRYTPLLTPIAESALHNVRRPLTRINSPMSSVSASKYIPPRPIPINTADIDVSASRFRDRHRERDIFIPKKIDTIYGSSSTNGTIELSTPTATVETHSSHPDEGDRKCGISRNRSVVRLSTIRSRDKSRSDDRKKQADKDEIMEKIKSGLKNPEVLDKKTKTTWREKFEDEELNVKLRDPPPKSPGDLLREKHLIKEKEKEEEKSPNIRRRSIKKRASKKLPSFHDICRVISSDKINDDLNANELRGLPTLSVEEHEEHLIKKIRRLSSGNVGVFEEPKVAPILEDEIIDVITEPVETTEFVKKTKKKPKQKITGTVDVDLPQPKAVFDVEIHDPETVVQQFTKKPPVKFNAVLEDENHTTHTIIKLPAIRPKKNLEVPKQNEFASRNTNESNDNEDFWGNFSSRETVYLNNRKQKMLENQQDLLHQQKYSTEQNSVEAETKVIENCDITEQKKTEIDESKIDNNTTAVVEKLKSEQKVNKFKGMKINKIEKRIDKPKLFDSPKKVDGLKSSRAVISYNKTKTPPPPTSKSQTPPPTENCITHATPSESNMIKLNANNKEITNEKSDETASDSTTTDPVKKCEPKVQSTIVEKTAIVPIKNEIPEILNDSIENASLQQSNDGNTNIDHDHDHDQMINKIENELPGNLSKFPTFLNLNDLSNETISSDFNAIVNKTNIQYVADTQTDFKTDQSQEQIAKEPPAEENGEVQIVETKPIEDGAVSASPEMAIKKKKVIVKVKKSKSSETDTTPSDSPKKNVSPKKKLSPDKEKPSPKEKMSSKDRFSPERESLCEHLKRSANNNETIENSAVDTSDPKEENNEEISDEKKKSEVKKVFDPSKNMRFDSKRVKFYKVDEPMLRPVVARPRPLRKKQIFSSSSDDSDDSSDDSEESTESEHSSDGSFESTSPGMSTCSVDSGFVSGSATPTPKKMLGN